MGKIDTDYERITLKKNVDRKFSRCLIPDIYLFLTRQVCLRHYEHEFMELACQCPVVVCCRCSPQQKADIVKLLKKHTGKRTCAIGEMSRSSSRSPSLSACPSASVRIWCTMHLVRILRKFEIFYFFFATILLLFHI